MARKTGVPEAPSPQVLGHMIGRLSTMGGSSWYRHPPKKFFTLDQIAGAFGISEKEIPVYIKAWREAPHGNGRILSRETVERAFNKFVHKNKRWPRTSDCRKWRENGLPSSMRSFNTHWGNGYWGSGGYSALIDNYCRKFPGRVSPQMVFQIPNLTTRRDQIVRIGIDKLTDHGTVVQQDDFGKLWEFPFRDGADLVMLYVEVVNKTPQFDAKGKVVKDKNGDPVFDHYFLRVPPNTRRAKDAVAWVSNVRVDTFAGFAAES